MLAFCLVEVTDHLGHGPQVTNTSFLPEMILDIDIFAHLIQWCSALCLINLSLWMLIFGLTLYLDLLDLSKEEFAEVQNFTQFFPFC